uniref:Uncharacterized protein n=1 Tax=viral metagenome TaxID=1070528 RepID=A0A6M3LS61_9ZZZZ
MYNTGKVLFNTDTGELAVTRNKDGKLGQVPLNPVTFQEDWDKWSEGKGWKRVTPGHPVQQYVTLFDAIYGANWYFNVPEGWDVDEYYIKDEREVFEKIRKLFEGS